MSFSHKTLDALEYYKITEKLASLAPTEGARAQAIALSPSSDYEAVLKRQRQTLDAKRLINAKGYPTFSADISLPSIAERAYKGAQLSPSELLLVGSMLYSSRMLLDFIRCDKLFDTSLDEVFERLLPARELEEHIKRAILAEDVIADEASVELADIRRKIKNTNNKIKDTLQSYVGGNRLKYLQDNLVTMRGGRYVVPVKAEYKNEIKGLVHDTSASGATLFVEPMAVVDANNELKALFAKEKHEIDRILSELSAECANYCSLIELNYRNITELAFIFTKASLAIDMKAEMPKIVRESRISLKRARHPLLDRARVVPIDVALGYDYDTLVITGPNTGGKTVTLKTLGLLAVMTAAGLQIPADEGSEVGIFDAVLVDIGDEQSIEASLSTFSSHMVNVVDILQNITERSLVLFDELGSGTDPIEGAALAIAILERTRACGALAAATTHYAELKMYALDTEGVRNASCEFDVESLRPTYKLIIGTPGKSNAFAISEKLGMPSEVLSRAEELIERDNKRFEEVIERLDTDRMKMEKEKETAERLRHEYEAFKERSEGELRRKIKGSQEEIEKNLVKSRQILDSCRASSEFIFRQMEKIRREEDKARRDEMLKNAAEDARRLLREGDDMISSLGVKEISLDEEYTLPRPLRVGDRVYLTTVMKEGIVSALAKNGLVEVTAGILKTKVTEDKLRLLTADERVKVKTKAPPREGKVKKTVNTSFKIEVDVRGMIGDDAWFVVDKHIDDAILASVPFVRIIHGKGTGALRAALWRNFKTDRRIKSYRHAEYGDGDAGVTILEFTER